MHRKIITPVFILGLFAADRISKILAQKFLAGGQSVKIFTFFHLTYVENTGAAFGMFHDGNAVLTAASVVMIAALCVIRRKLAGYGRMAGLAAALIISGALGNLYDRIRLGFVVDFLDFRIWPVFNLADSYISIGAVLFLSAMKKDPKPEKKDINHEG